MSDQESRKFSEFNAYLQGVQTRVQLVIVTTSLVVTAVSQVASLLPKPPLHGLPFPVFAAAVAFLYSVYSAAVEAGLSKDLREKLVKWLGVNADIPMSSELHKAFVREFLSKHRTLRFARIALFEGIFGLILYALLVICAHFMSSVDFRDLIGVNLTIDGNFFNAVSLLLTGWLLFNGLNVCGHENLTIAHSNLSLPRRQI